MGLHSIGLQNFNSLRFNYHSDVALFLFFLIQGRVAFGNKLLETTLCFKFECVTGIYTTSQANSSLDEFMHIVKCQGKNVRVILSPSPSYNGPTDE